MSLNEITEKVFNALYNAVQNEIDFLFRNEILQQYHNEADKAVILVKILQEHTLRYIMTRKFYEPLENRVIKFGTEVDYIDIVFYEHGKKYAYEIKRWQTNKERDEIKTNDILKLKGFFEKDKKNTSCYELIFSANNKKKSKEDYQKDFKDDALDEYLMLLDCKPIACNDALTACVFVAELKV